MLKSFWTLLVLVTIAGLAVGAGLAAATSRAPANNATIAAAAPSGASTRQGASAADGANARQSGGAADFANRRTVAGTVEQVEGQKLVVKSDNGSVQLVLNEQTTYRKMVKGGLDDLKAGETVIARTEAGADGATVARNLQLVPMTGGQAVMVQGMGGMPGGTAGGANRRGDGANAGASAGAGRTTFGTIQTADGKTITLTTPAGSVKLTIADGAEIRRSDAANRDELKPGLTVTAVGQSAAAGDSSLTAVTVTIGGE